VRENEKEFGIEHFTPHDLRRTAASFMTKIGVPRLHVEFLARTELPECMSDDERRGSAGSPTLPRLLLRGIQFARNSSGVWAPGNRPCCKGRTCCSGAIMSAVGPGTNEDLDSLLGYRGSIQFTPLDTALDEQRKVLWGAQAVIDLAAAALEQHFGSD
jgi:hypothetical protein